jgi:hypothetical protein
MSEDKSEAKTNPWKNKAKLRQKENTKLSKRLKEVTSSRDAWKKKHQSLKHGIGKSCGSRPRGHHYPMLVVELCIKLCRYGGMSLRCCEHCLRCVSTALGLRVPSHVSIRNWLLKYGYYLLQGRGGASPSGGRWALIVDESVTIGTERLLVVLGLEIGGWGFKRPPALEDVQVLHLEVRGEWKGEAVGEVLKEVISGRQVVQGTSDAGRNLLNAFELCGLRHLPDCSHAFAAILERHLGHEEQFKELGRLNGQLRQYWATSQYAGWMPPKHRGKSRFMNVFPVVKWAEKILANEPVLPPAVRQKTGWLFEHREFLEDLGCLRQMVTQLLSMLKCQGACTKSLDAAQVFLSKTLENASARVQSIGKKIEGYLQVLGSKITDDETAYLCCSDIIESLFGKFKYALNPANPSKITERALIIPYFCGSLDGKEVKIALENVTNEQVKNWRRGRDKPASTN